MRHTDHTDPAAPADPTAPAAPLCHLRHTWPRARAVLHLLVVCAALLLAAPVVAQDGDAPDAAPLDALEDAAPAPATDEATPEATPEVAPAPPPPVADVAPAPSVSPLGEAERVQPRAAPVADTDPMGEGWVLYDFAFGSGGLTGQFDKVFEDVTFVFNVSIGLRSERHALTLDFSGSVLDSSVVEPLSAISFGLGSRYYLPWLDARHDDFEVWLSNGVGYTGLTACEEDDPECDLSGDVVMAEYSGLYLSTGLAAAWVFYRDEGAQAYFTLEARHAWHYLENSSLDRHIMGGYSSLTGGIGFAAAP